MEERLMKQGYDPLTGKDRVGQDIEKRDWGKMAPPSAAKVSGDVLRTAPNFNRAEIPVTSPKDYSGSKLDNQHEGNVDKTAVSEEGDFEKGMDDIKSKEPHKETR